MKRLFLITVTLLMFLNFASCSSDDDKTDDRIRVTQSDIQGSWAKKDANGTLINLVFTGNAYLYRESKAGSNHFSNYERGTFTIDDLTMTMTTDDGDYGVYPSQYVYFTSKGRDYLMIWPAGGEFVRTEL